MIRTREAGRKFHRAEAGKKDGGREEGMSVSARLAKSVGPVTGCQVTYDAAVLVGQTFLSGR